MAEQLSAITTLANNSVNTLIALANAIVNTLATTAVTANGSANGALTNGNGYVSGIFGAATIGVGSLRGGNVQSSANLVISSNVFVNSSSLMVGNTTVNAVMTGSTLTVAVVAATNATVGYFPQSSLSFANAQLTDVELTTTGTGTVTLDSYPLSTLRTAEYLIQVRDNTANNYQCSKFLVTHDGGTPVWTEYGLLTTNNSIATFGVTTNATTLILQVTPGPANTTVRAIRTALNS